MHLEQGQVKEQEAALGKDFRPLSDKRDWKKIIA